MRKECIQQNGWDGLPGLGALLNHTDAVDNDPRLQIEQHLVKKNQIFNIYIFNNISLVK